MNLTCFTAYDIRGRLGDALNEEIAYRIGRAFAMRLGAKQVVVGRDCRESSASLQNALMAGLMDAGATALDLGLCGTEEVYFGTTHLQADGGIMVTASHNPIDYNGMKMVQAGSAPIGSDTGMDDIKQLAEAGNFPAVGERGQRIDRPDVRADYVTCALSFVDVAALRPMKILVNAGNGAAGPTFDAIAARLAAIGAPLEFVTMHHAPDGSFPNGIPNPLLPENQPVTAAAVLHERADFGVAWDGDFDRCFFFDHQGGFIAGEYVVGLLAEVFLAKIAGATIIHDPRVVWNTQDVVAKAGGRAVQARTGHAFLKKALRDTGAVYGGEMSAHHYFRDFMSCDSGMIPWLLVAELLGRRGVTLAALMSERSALFPSSGEINFRVSDAKAAVAAVIAAFGPAATGRDDTDGVSLSFADWRFNIRSSNTEPLLRLNVESRGDAGLVKTQVDAISQLIRGFAA